MLLPRGILMMLEIPFQVQQILKNGGLQGKVFSLE